MNHFQYIDEVQTQIEAYIHNANSQENLVEIEQNYLKKKGPLKDLQRKISQLDVTQRPAIGRAIQECLSHLKVKIQQQSVKLENFTISNKYSEFDITIPGVDFFSGGLHPTVQMMYDLNDAFTQLNFDVYDGPDISSERSDFDNLNFSPDHPARESMDTFWLIKPDRAQWKERYCLRPHLTGASVRYMQLNEPPFRFVYPGRVYRNETTDARHERAFFQYEALIVDEDIPFSAGQLLVSTILDTVFGFPVKTRMRAGFFPFVEPGFEIDMLCQVCAGDGCPVCKQVGWLEIMPGGVPHPNVLASAGLDANRWTGFYINVGLDRLVMMRYGIDDVRLFNSADLRFLSQFK